MLQGWDLDQLIKIAFKLKFSTKWMQIISKYQTHYQDWNVSLFPTAVAEFKLPRLTIPQRKFEIEFMMKHDSSKNCRIQLNKTFF